MDKHMKWLARVTGTDSGRTVALKAGASVATINRQIGKGELTAENVILIARGYGQPVTEALAQTGYITADEASGLPRTSLAKLLTDQDLIHELAVRVDDDESAWSGTFSEVVTDAEGDELAARRAAASRHDGTVREWDDSVPHAADGSPEEALGREEWGEDPID